MTEPVSIDLRKATGLRLTRRKHPMETTLDVLVGDVAIRLPTVSGIDILDRMTRRRVTVSFEDVPGHFELIQVDEH